MLNGVSRLTLGCVACVAVSCGACLIALGLLTTYIDVSNRCEITARFGGSVCPLNRGWLLMVVCAVSGWIIIAGIFWGVRLLERISSNLAKHG
jgi:hypothetical protein